MTKENTKPGKTGSSALELCFWRMRKLPALVLLGSFSPDIKSSGWMEDPGSWLAECSGPPLLYDALAPEGHCQGVWRHP